MITKDDLENAVLLLKDEIKKESQATRKSVKQEVKSVKKEVQKSQNEIINFFDRENQRTRKRLDRIETELKLPVIDQSQP